MQKNSIFLQPKTCALFTVGCRLNQYETEAIGQQLEQAGYERVDFGKPADLYVVNTCTVTAGADASSRQAIARAARYKGEGKLIVTGCYAQVARETVAKLPGVDAVFDNYRKDNFLQLLSEWNGLDGQEPAEPVVVKGHRAHTRGLVKIQDGCNEWCAYCVIPMSRGDSRCRPAEQITAEVRSLVEHGFKEVVITGVHIGKYRHDELDLVGLLRRILDETDVARLRLSSIKPNEVTPELIDLIASSGRICRFVHMPLQSGDDTTLKRMKRSYDCATYLRIAERLKEKIPGLTIGADVIVGFPGETDEQFENGARFIEDSPIDYLHVFSYSDRPNTAASRMPDKVPPQVKDHRSFVLRQLSDKKWKCHLDRFIGQRMPVLVEENGKVASCKTAIADNFIRVLLPENGYKENSIVEVIPNKREGKSLVA